MQTQRIGMVFGGVSPEHEVSVISCHQAIAALREGPYASRYQVVPIYIAKDGTWYTGGVLFDLDAYQDLDTLRKRAVPVTVGPGGFGQLALTTKGEKGLFGRKPETITLDVIFLGLHGGSGEDGGLQGLCETFNVPYTGSGVFGSALGMDKVISKMLCRDQGIPVVDFVAFRESEWADHEEDWLGRCEADLGYPVVVKPARLGSSIGITLARDRDALDAAIEEALRYDAKVIVEQGVQQLREINCAVLGDVDEAVASVLEEPVTGEALLTFQEKYMRGDQQGGKGRAQGGAKQAGAAGMASLDRIIPAEIPEAQAAAIRTLAVQVFQAFECAGVARIDFMIDGRTEQVYFNEINTIPGSFSFYLWEPSGVPFHELVHRMITLALQRHRDRNSRVRSYDVNLLAAHSLKGLKGKG